jgi:hypothetical protein
VRVRGKTMNKIKGIERPNLDDWTHPANPNIEKLKLDYKDALRDYDCLLRRANKQLSILFDLNRKLLEATKKGGS